MRFSAKVSARVSGAVMAGAILLGTVACQKPQASQVSGAQTANTPAQLPTGQDDAAQRQAEADRLKAEQAKSETARLAAAQAAYQSAAQKALQDVHFDLDKSSIRDEDKAILQGIAEFMKAYPFARIQIEGHCDERGTIEYNLSLGQKRATAIRTYLVGFGVPESRFSLISYGKEKPLCTESNDGCWFLNRRGHSVLQ